jgi:hypothetical protein
VRAPLRRPDAVLRATAGAEAESNASGRRMVRCTKMRNTMKQNEKEDR